MDAVQICRGCINRALKYYWIIEGDIKGCFDNIDHQILLKLLRNRIADRRLIGIIHRLLKAGYQENGSIYKPDKGTPQGGVISPLLANIYLHELDKWWSENYHRSREYMNARRREQRGNFILTRFADDFIILSNGTKKATEIMKGQVAEFLKDELKLELSQEKTTITHAFDGFNFPGFHIQKYKRKRSAQGVIIEPTRANVQKVKDKIARLLERRNHEYAVVNVICALNPIVRGWVNYYRFSNSYKTFHSLDLYLKNKFLKWYRGKFQLPLRVGTREGLRWIDKKELIHLYQFGEIRMERYRNSKKSNPYIEMDVKRMTEHPFPEVKWYGNADRDADLRMQSFQRDDGVCQICMRPKINLIAHDIIPISKGGENVLDNLTTLCEDCHRKYHKELHYECRSLEEIRRLGGSRVR